MRTPIVRDVRWRFAADTPFQWNPANPAFGLAMNTLTFIAPPFERYIVVAVREAMRVIEDPATLAEADAFLKKWQSVTSWTYQEVGVAKKNPAELGIAKP